MKDTGEKETIAIVRGCHQPGQSCETVVFSRTLSILGATGSIGVNTLDVVRHAGGAFEVVALTGSANVRLLAKQAIEHRAKIAVTADERQYGALKEALAGTGIEAAAGRQALCDAAAMPADITMAAIVGMAGLEPTLAAAKNGGTIALANKECLVAGGKLFMDAVKASGGTLLPVDSEHNAIFQVLSGEDQKAVERVILTASGGPFRTWSVERMADVTVETARAHPNWSMGLKISIDSASLFNKALEMIEARHLFGLSPEQVEVIVHPQSIIHSMVAYRDGSILAQLGPRTCASPSATHCIFRAVPHSRSKGWILPNSRDWILRRRTKHASRRCVWRVRRCRLADCPAQS